MAELISEGDRLVSNYLHTVENLARYKQQVNGAECDLTNAETALAKWLMPTDMKPGEKIAVWRGDSLFQVDLEPHTSYSGQGGEEHIDYRPKITVRLRGKEFGRLRVAS